MGQPRIIKHVGRNGSVSWRVRLDLVTDEGRRAQPQRTYDSREDAEAALREWAAQVSERGSAGVALGPASHWADPTPRDRWREWHGRAIYFILAPRLAAIKIGVSSDVAARIADIQCGCPDRLRLVALRRSGPAPHREVDLHARFATLRIVGEWFRAEEPLLSYIATFAHPPRLYYERTLGSLAAAFFASHPSILTSEDDGGAQTRTSAF